VPTTPACVTVVVEVPACVCMCVCVCMLNAESICRLFNLVVNVVRCRTGTKNFFLIRAPTLAEWAKKVQHFGLGGLVKIQLAAFVPLTPQGQGC